MAKKHIKLQRTEGVIVQAAAQIYAAYITHGQVSEENRGEWMKKSMREAIALAKGIDDAVICDGEME